MRAAPTRGAARLSTKTQFLENRLVAVDLRVSEVVQELTPLPDFFEETSAGVVVCFVDLEMLGKLLDFLGQKSDLNLW